MGGKSASALSVDLQVACDAPELPSQPEIEAWLQMALGESDVSATRDVEVSIRVVDEEESQDLNKRFRGKDRSTNVLAFPAGRSDSTGLPNDGPQLLGDLVICAPVVAREAAEQGKEPAAHWGHMLVHGLLHLLGFDHDSDAEAVRMESLEVSILAARGLENPYKDEDSN